MNKGNIFTSTECCICFEEDVSLVLYLPCGHRAVCAACDANEKPETCWTCRTPISERLSTAQPRQQQQPPADNSNNAQPQQHPVTLPHDRPFSTLGLILQFKTQQHIASKWREVAIVSDKFDKLAIDLIRHHAEDNIDAAGKVFDGLNGRMASEFTVGFLTDVLRQCDMNDVADWLADEISK
jgi:hypothetical protein